MTGIVTGFAAKAVVGGALGGIGRFLRSIPWQVWLAIGVAIALLLAVRWHNHEVKAADRAGYARAMGEVRAEQERIRAAAERLKEKAETAQRNINEEVRINHVKEIGDVHARADALRLRGPQAAAAGIQANRAGVPGGAGGAQGTGEAAGLPGMAIDPRGRFPGAAFASIPWQPLVDHGEQCDVYRAQVSGWQGWYDKQAAAWAAWLAEANAAAGKTRPTERMTDGR